MRYIGMWKLYVKILNNYRNDTSNKCVCLSVNNELRKNIVCGKEFNVDNFKIKYGNWFVLKDNKLIFIYKYFVYWNVLYMYF